MAETEEAKKVGGYGILTSSKTNASVSVATTLTNIISSTEIYGYKGSFGVSNAGSETITVYPRVSFDNITWFEMDNGSGLSVASSGTRLIPFTGNYRYIKLDAISPSTTNTATAYMYVSSV